MKLGPRAKSLVGALTVAFDRTPRRRDSPAEACADGAGGAPLRHGQLEAILVRQPQIALWDELDDDVRVRIDELLGVDALTEKASVLRIRWLAEARLRGFRTAAAIRGLFTDHRYTSDLQEVCIRACRSNYHDPATQTRRAGRRTSSDRQP